ncbi:MAG: glycosyl hydrolase 53 family protein [Coprobacillus sp.]|nr:glycosyl hydrolase 53 family protein [Coprobacillus sp.]
MKRKVTNSLFVLLLGTLALSSCSGGTIRTGAKYEAPEDHYDYASEGVQVGQIEALTDDYIMGVDISSIIEVEEAGGIFYDWDGNETDLITFLADNGVNYVRIRLWNDPYDEDGNSFQGGGNDLETDLKIAKRAAEAGLQICLDFHYSDFWADPSKQTMPRAWQGYGINSDAVINDAVAFTTDTLQAFKDAGCEPSMVQVGNEINNAICGYSDGTWNRNYFLYQCCNAVRKFNPDIKIVFHLAEGANYEGITYFMDQMAAFGVDYDVIGLSYYSYYHGGIADFEDCLTKLDKNYDKEICVMEYSYGFTNEYDDNYPNMANIYNSSFEDLGGYYTSVQGQASYIHDVNEVVANTYHGIGSFYWEPAWLAREGTSWASSYAHNYLLAQGDAGGEDTCTWANQALFDYDGYPLASLKAFNLMRHSGYVDEYAVSAYTSFDYRFNVAAKNLDDEFPSSIQVFTTLDRWVDYDISWDKADKNTVKAGAEGDVIEVHGTASKGSDSFRVTGFFTLYKEYIADGGFEEIATPGEAKEAPGWEVSGTDGSYRFEITGNAYTGLRNYNAWYGSSYNNDLHQTVSNLDAGTATFDCYLRSGSGAYPTTTLYATIGGKTYEQQVTWNTTWPDWQHCTLEFPTTNGASAVVGLKVVGQAEDWLHADDFSLAIAKA